MTDIAIQELRSLILKAKHAYYYSGELIMSDAETTLEKAREAGHHDVEAALLEVSAI